MLRSIIKSILVLIVYFAIYFGVKRLLNFLLSKEIFSDLNPDYLLFISPFLNLLFILLLVWILKRKKILNTKEIIFKVKPFFIVFFLSISFFLIKEPFLRIDFIFNEIEIPENINERQRTLVDLYASFLGLVIITPIFEELLFRKVLLSFFSKKHIFYGIISSSIIFALIHLNFYEFNLFTLITSFLFGFIACVLYVRFGFIYNLVFHVISNAIWFCVDLNRIMYWQTLRTLDFGLIYWLIIITSLSIIFYSVFNIFKEPIFDNGFHKKL